MWEPSLPRVFQQCQCESWENSHLSELSCHDLCLHVYSAKQQGRRFSTLQHVQAQGSTAAASNALINNDVIDCSKAHVQYLYAKHACTLPMASMTGKMHVQGCTSRVRCSQWLSAEPLPPWFSSSTPCSSGQPKNDLASRCKSNCV